MNKKIFIGSSSEKKPLAIRIAQELEENGFEPLRWWTQFPPNSYNLLRLKEIAQCSYGAVLIFSKDDKLWLRGNEVGVPRDNVILEYGLFVGKLIDNHVVVVREEGVELPTDLAGLNHIDLNISKDTVAENTAGYFSKLPFVKKATRIKCYHKIVDHKLADYILNEKHRDWSSRSLYIGDRGAKRWINISKDRNYLPENMKCEIIEKCVEFSKDLPVNYFVSLGAGDGYIDTQILCDIVDHDRHITYIPIDINTRLIDKAVNTVTSKGVNVEYSIHSDFEGNLGFIFEQQSLIEEPILYVMLGDSYGNIELSERTLLSDIKRYMKKTDYFLLEISIKNDSYSLDKDKPVKECFENLNIQKFIANGISFHARIPFLTALDELKDRLELVEVTSRIPKAITINFRDKKLGKVLFSARRFDVDEFVKYLQRKSVGFDIIDKHIIFDELRDENVGRALFLLQPKK